MCHCPIADEIKVEESEDQKVLTLAEQFIAAMPDRIKVRTSIQFFR